MDISPGFDAVGGGGEQGRGGHQARGARPADEGEVAVIHRQVPPMDQLSEVDRARVLKARVDAVVEFNTAALKYVTRVGDADTKTGQSRWIVTIVLAAVLVVGAFAVALTLVFSGGDGWAATASAAVAIGVLAVAGWLNPLQTIERDVVFRRWSDAIMAAFFLQAGDYDATKDDVRAASRRASLDFAILAAAYGKETKQTSDALARIVEAQTKPTPAEEDEPAALALANPGAQSSTVGVPIEKLTLEASGPSPRAFSGTLPPGLAIAPETGEIDGAPEKAGETEATVTVTVEDGSSVSATFSWTVLEPDPTAAS